MICNSRFTAGTFQRTYAGVPRSIIYCPVNSPRQWDAAELLETRYKLDTALNSVAIVQSSRIEPCKGHRLHIKALSLLAKVPGWVCSIAGAPQRPFEERYFEVLKQDARRYAIAERVRFTGWIDNIRSSWQPHRSIASRTWGRMPLA